MKEITITRDRLAKALAFRTAARDAAARPTGQKVKERRENADYLFGLLRDDK